MKKIILFLLFVALFAGCAEITVGYKNAEEYLATIEEENKIYYQSLDGRAVETNRITGNVKMISNSYESGQGVITFSLPISEVFAYMFNNCNKLTSIHLSNCVTKIGDYTFSGCSHLAEIALPIYLRTIGHNAFRGCFQLTEITLPSTLETIGALAFQECIFLTDFYCKAETPPSGGDRMFLGCSPELKIYVPRASVELYKEAKYWRDYAERIVGYDF
jgi:hypothetical protein